MTGIPPTPTLRRGLGEVNDLLGRISAIDDVTAGAAGSAQLDNPEYEDPRPPLRQVASAPGPSR